MDNDTRRTLIPSFLPPLMTPRSYPFFCFAYSGSTSVMTISTNACLKLGLLHRLFFFFWNGLCNATNGRKTHAVFCISISLHHERLPSLPRVERSEPFPRAFCIRHTPALLRAVPTTPISTVLYRHTHLYVCAQYSALARARLRSLEERNVRLDGNPFYDRNWLLPHVVGCYC